MRRVRLAAALPLAASLCAFATSANAAPIAETEPNGDIWSATTFPAEGVAGSIADANDLDIFALWLRPGVPFKLAVQALACDDSTTVNAGMSISTRHESGGRGLDDYTNSVSPNYNPIYEANSVARGLPGGPPTLYYLDLRGNYACTYQASIAGDAVAPPPAAPPFASTAEPNDLVPFGPLTGGVTYTGAFETSNDVDKVSIALKAGRQVRITVSTNGGLYSEGGLGDQLVAKLAANKVPYSPTGDEDLELQGPSTETAGFTTTTDDPETITLTGDTNAQWRLSILPADAVGTPPPAAAIASDDPVRVSRRVTIERVRGRYRGRVSADVRACRRNVRVELRRKGKGPRSYGSTTTRADGSWTIKSRPKPGKIYALVVEERRADNTALCLSAKSQTLRRTR